MVTSSYVHLTVQDRGEMSGRIISIAPGNEVTCGFQIIVETFLDRMRHGQVNSEQDWLITRPCMINKSCCLRM